MRNLFFTLAILFCSSMAQATTVYVYTNQSSTNKFKLLEGVALNGAAATRTITLPLGNAEAGKRTQMFTQVKVCYFYTNSAGTAVTLTLTGSIDGTNYGSEITRSCSAGTCTVNAMVDSNAVSGDEDMCHTYDVRGYASVQVVFACTSADASDLIDVNAVAVGGD